MTVAEIIEQAKALTPEEREELIAELASMQINVQSKSIDAEQHWGKTLNKMMDEIGSIEMKYPEIEDPVEWVKHLRAEQRKHRLGAWDASECQIKS